MSEQTVSDKGNAPASAAPAIVARGLSKRFNRRLGRSDRSQLAIWFWELDRVTLTLIGILMAIGLIAVAAASPATAARLSTDSVTLDPLYFFYRQLRWLILGVPGMIVISMLPKTQARRLAIAAMVFFGMLLILVPVIGETKNGAQRWIGYGLTIQPSEFLKPAFAVTIAWILSLKARDPELPVMSVTFGITCIVGFFLMAQPNLGGTIVFFGIWFVLALLAGLSFQVIAGSIVAGIGGLTTAYLFYPVATQRINAWLFGGESYDQVALAHNTLTNGGFIGAGPGLGTAKFRLPEAHTDYIFSVIGEEFGLLACAAIAILYLVFIARVLLRLQEEKNLFLSLAVTGLAAQIGGQAMINLAVNLQLFPSKGMTLPFISYGGSSMLALCFSAGLLLALSRRNPYLDRSSFDRSWQQ
ncbi:MAG: putative peptidoglycan glycosyltransferase FtsW [Pseudomonadota bacterium]